MKHRCLHCDLRKQNLSNALWYVLIGIIDLVNLVTSVTSVDIRRSPPDAFSLKVCCRRAFYVLLPLLVLGSELFLLVAS